MATKEESIKDCLKIFDQYGHLLDECKITREQRMRWLECIENYKEARLCNGYVMTKLLVRLLTMAEVWKRFTPDEWSFIRMRNIKDTQDLNAVINDIKLSWKNRPQFHKRKYT